MPDPSTTTALAITDDEIAACNELHHAATAEAQTAKAAAERACHLAVLLGLRLRAIKERLPHGQFGQLFDGEKNDTCVAFGLRTAQRYMAAAEGALSRPGLSQAARARLLRAATSDTVGQPGERIQRDLETATAGQTLRQLYLDLGIVRAAAHEQTPVPTRAPARDQDTGDSDTGDDMLHRLTSADVYTSLTRELEPFTRSCNRGDLSLLDPPHLDQLAEILRSYLDDIRRARPTAS